MALLAGDTQYIKEKCGLVTCWGENQTKGYSVTVKLFHLTGQESCLQGKAAQTETEKWDRITV
jgi:hypothetical protein